MPRAAAGSSRCCGRAARASITATELGHVPGSDEADVERVAITDGRVLQTESADAFPLAS